MEWLAKSSHIYDTLNVIYALLPLCLQELLQVNLLKGASNLMRSANPIGRAALPLRDICNKPYERQVVDIRCADFSSHSSIVGFPELHRHSIVCELSGSAWAHELELRVAKQGTDPCPFHHALAF
jgi:hypothetical protein